MCIEMTQIAMFNQCLFPEQETWDFQIKNKSKYL